jgi:hypothetical protein
VRLLVDRSANPGGDIRARHPRHCEQLLGELQEHVSVKAMGSGTSSLPAK